MLQVKYKGMKYKSTFKNATIICYLKNVLYFKRLSRRAKIILKKNDLMLYGLIILLWLIFAFVSNRVDNNITNIDKKYLLSLWELRNSMFSSVILAFAISSFNRIEKYRQILRKQHYNYVDAMNDFELILNAYGDLKWRLHYYAFYNRRCFELTKVYLVNEKKKINFKEKDFIINIDIISGKIKSLENELKDGNFVISDEDILKYMLSDARKKVSKLMLNQNEKLFWELVLRLYCIIGIVKKSVVI